MAIAVVHRKNSPSTAAATLAIESATASNVLVAFIATSTLTEPTVKDNLGATWAINATKSLGATSKGSLWLATKTAAGGETEISATGATVQGVSYLELSGASSTIDVIHATENAATAKGITSPETATTDAGDVIIGGVGAANAGSVGTLEAWTATGTAPVLEQTETANTRCFIATKIPGATASGTYSAHWQTERPAGMIVVAIKPASGGSSFSRSSEDPLALAESTSRVAAFVRPLPADPISLAESTTATHGVSRSTADALSLAESTSRTAATTRSSAEVGVFTMSESVSGSGVAPAGSGLGMLV